MKSVCLALCLMVVIALGDQVQDRWNKVHQECQRDPDLYVDDIIFEKIKKGESPALPTNFGQHAFCMLNNLDLQDDEGEVLKEGVKQAVARGATNPQKIEQIINECSSIDLQTEEETALGLFGCFGKHGINIGQL